MTGTLNTRVFLSVPVAEKGDAKLHGASWDAVLGKWWIERRDIGAHPAVYRWITDNPVLRAQAKEAFDFLRGKRRGPRTSGSNRKARAPRH